MTAWASRFPCQEEDLLIVAAGSRDALSSAVDALAEGAHRRETGSAAGPWRAACVVPHNDPGSRQLRMVGEWLRDGVDWRHHPRSGTFLGRALAQPRVGFLFPGQGSPPHVDGGAWARTMPDVAELYAEARLPAAQPSTPDTSVAQPAIVTAAVAGLRVLAAHGIEAEVAIGHSVGELAALYWAGVWDARTALDVAMVRGRLMRDLGPRGAMASVAAGPARVDTLLAACAGVWVSCHNGPGQTVVGGTAAGVASAVAAAGRAGLTATTLPVAQAFHTPLMSWVADPFGAYLGLRRFGSPHGRVISTVTARVVEPDTDLRALLTEQMTAPVRFAEALSAAEADLWIEVGPGRVLTGLVARGASRAVALDAGAPTTRGLLATLAAAFCVGVDWKMPSTETGQQDGGL
jgi:enediyne polyketide synthase